jgi:hypothetical protein
MNDHRYVAFVVVIVEPSIMCGNEWSCDYDKRNISMIIHYHTEYLVQLWQRQTEHIHDHSLPHRINQVLCLVMNDHGYVSFVVVIAEPSIMSGNEWSWICSVCRSHRHNTWFKHDHDKRNISMIIHYHTEYLVQLWLRQTEHIHDHSLPHRILGSTKVFCVVMNDHGYVPFVVVMFEPSIMSGNEWSWICFVCRSHDWTKYFVW